MVGRGPQSEMNQGIFGSVTGIYGVPAIKQRDPSAYVGEMAAAGVNAVFVPADKETVAWFKAYGFQVYVSVNAFGGKGAWQKYADARPVNRRGELLGAEPGFKGHGGACPTHPGWRNERLKYVAQLVETLGGEGGIDGIWLDFIRYPGFWETTAPEIPDTCYCSRCLNRFAADSGVAMPKGLGGKEAAAWIQEKAPHEWMTWKKERIADFVKAVKKILAQNPGKKALKLGLFLVPWTKGERNNAVSYVLGQDPFALGELVDVVSPMVYHRMCGKSPRWVGDMVDYYQETMKCRVWPIVQAVDCSAEDFEAAVSWAWKGGADGVLVYSFGAWLKARGARRMAQSGEKLRMLAGEKEEISVRADDAWGNEWVAPLTDGVPGEEYTFRGEFWRDGWQNGIYPEVSLWGERFFVNTHLKAGVFQPIRVNVVCPNEIKDPNFRFINRNRGTTFKLRNPSVARKYRFQGEPVLGVARGFFNGNSFPIGVYGAAIDNLEEIKGLAVNTVILGGSGEGLKRKIEKCHGVGLRYVVSVPHDPDLLPVFLDRLSQYARPWDMAFYVNDEPGIWSFPVNRANDINRFIKERFPGCATCMAVVRPQVCGDYARAADFFMLDQYPVPFMPFSWLSDCMGECANSLAHVEPKGLPDAPGLLGAKAHNPGLRRLAAVIQAFGGEKYADLGWPRLPTGREMTCLAFLSVVNGARGIFFYSYGTMGKTAEGRKALGSAVGRLNQVYPWLVVENSEETVSVEMVSENRFDPRGRPAVQCCLKQKGNDALLVAVNTLGTGVEILLGEKALNEAGERAGCAREVFSGEAYKIKNGKIRVKLGPYGVLAFVFPTR